MFTVLLFSVDVNILVIVIVPSMIPRDENAWNTNIIDMSSKAVKYWSWPLNRTEVG